jgi:CRP-like cAMP-binding protein
MLRRSERAYRELAITSSLGRRVTPRPEVLARSLATWYALIEAVETSNDRMLTEIASEVGRFQSGQHIPYSDAVSRALDATNQIELAVVQSLEGRVSPELMAELGDLRTRVLTAIIDGYFSGPPANGVPSSAPDDGLAGSVAGSGVRYDELNLARGEPVPAEGAVQCVYFIVAGMIRLFSGTASGRSITVSLLGAGEAFLLDSARRVGVRADALRPARLVRVPVSEIPTMLKGAPIAGTAMLTHLAKRLEDSQAVIAGLLYDAADLRVARSLLTLARGCGVRLAPQGGERGPIEVEISHRELADLAGVNRVTVTRKMRELANLGILRLVRQYRKVVILDEERLQRLAGE